MTTAYRRLIGAAWSECSRCGHTLMEHTGMPAPGNCGDFLKREPMNRSRIEVWKKAVASAFLSCIDDDETEFYVNWMLDLGGIPEEAAKVHSAMHGTQEGRSE